MRQEQQHNLQSLLYPTGQTELGALLDFLLKQNNPSLAEQPQAIIVPQGALSYSGECAAAAYSLLTKHSKLKNIYLCAAAEQSSFAGIKLPAKNHFSADFAKINLATEQIDKLISSNLISYDNKALQNEQGILAQLAFIQHIFAEQVKVTPALIGDLALADLTKFFTKILRAQDSLLIISTDLSNNLDLAREQSIDKKTIKAVEKLDADQFSTTQAYFFSALQAISNSAKQLDLNIKNLAFSNSSQVNHNQDYVTGYASFVIY